MNIYQKAYWHIAESISILEETIGKRPGGLVGVGGECWVMGLLIDNQIEFKARLGRTPYDIEILENNKRLEVKTSCLKSFLDKQKYYAWVIQRKPKEFSFDRLILVTLPEDLKNMTPTCYGFTKHQVENDEMFKFRVKEMLGKPYRGLLIYENELNKLAPYKLSISSVHSNTPGGEEKDMRLENGDI